MSFTYQPTPPDGPTLPIDPLPFILANSALTLLDQQPGEGKRAAAAHAVLTRGVGQPGALDPSVSDKWAGPTATLYNDLNTAAPDPDRPTLPDLPLRYRYRRCFPAKQFDKLDAPTSHSA